MATVSTIQVVNIPYHPEFRKVCRLCGKKVFEKLQSIFSYLKFRIQKNMRLQYLQISNIITDCTSTKIELLDEMPTEVCETCVMLLKKFYVFKIQCANSYIAFEKQISKNRENINCKQANENEEKVTIKKLNRKKINILRSNTKKINNNEFLRKENYKESNNNLEEMEVEYLDDKYIVHDLNSSGNTLEINTQTLENSINENIVIDVNEINPLFVSNDIEGKLEDVEQSLEKLFENTTSTISENTVQVELINTEEETYQINTNEEKFNNVKCTICFQEFESESELIIHNLEHGTGQREYLCAFCSDKYFTPNLLMLHLAESHTDRDNFICVYPDCPEQFTTAEDLLNHNDCHILGYQQKTKCDICNNIYLNENDCKLHRESHLGYGFQCNICTKIFLNESNLKIHRNRHDQNFNLLCSMCGKQFLSKGELENHSKSHVNVKYDACEICSKRFKCKSSLKNHLKIHVNDKPFLCQKCGLRFNHNGNLEAHLLRHEGVKNFKCLICKAELYSAYELKMHLRKHTGESPYNCKICDKNFRTSNGLKNHSVVHMDEEKHK